MTPSRTLTGKCLYGAVQYSVQDQFKYALCCHCSNCRQATGSAFKPFAGIERNRFSIKAGEGALLFFGEKRVHDVRCKKCGSLIYSIVRDGEYVHVTHGTLVDTPTIRPSAHLFVESKAPGTPFTISCLSTTSLSAGATLV